MSEWEFLWGLTGQELQDAMSCGCTREDAPCVEGWDASEVEYIAEVSGTLINGKPLESVLTDDSEVVLPCFKVSSMEKTSPSGYTIP